MSSLFGRLEGFLEKLDQQGGAAIEQVVNADDDGVAIDEGTVDELERFIAERPKYVSRRRSPAAV